MLRSLVTNAKNLNMRVLYISDRGAGGIKNHVRCVRASLPKEMVAYVIGEDEPFAGKSGHDWAEWRQIRRVVREFKPDVIHLHTFPLLMCLWLKLFSRVPRIASLHTPYGRKPKLKDRILQGLLRPCTYLPVSSVTWRGFKQWWPKAQGLVFFNPLRVSTLPEKRKASGSLVVGMVGRAAKEKDWPSFHRVEALVKVQMPEVEFRNLGEEAFCTNGVERIGEMDLYLMTSLSEELPTTLLEAFGMRTAACGFIPVGGVADILAFSEGPLREAFLPERDCEKLAAKVVELLRSPAKREALVRDGTRILAEHFDADRLVPGELCAVYRKCME